jgi:hypothetical protein
LGVTEPVKELKEKVGRKNEARTPRKTPRRTKANQTRKIRPAGELVLIG